MSRNTETCIKSVAAGLITGTLAYLAVQSICHSRLRRGMNAVKAFKTIGVLMDAFR